MSPPTSPTGPTTRAHSAGRSSPLPLTSISSEGGSSSGGGGSSSQLRVDTLPESIRTRPGTPVASAAILSPRAPRATPLREPGAFTNIVSGNGVRPLESPAASPAHQRVRVASPEVRDARVAVPGPEAREGLLSNMAAPTSLTSDSSAQGGGARASGARAATPAILQDTPPSPTNSFFSAGSAEGDHLGGGLQHITLQQLLDTVQSRQGGPSRRRLSQLKTAFGRLVGSIHVPPNFETPSMTGQLSQLPASLQTRTATGRPHSPLRSCSVLSRVLTPARIACIRSLSQRPSGSHPFLPPRGLRPPRRVASRHRGS